MTLIRTLDMRQFNLNMIDDITISSPADNDILQYDSTTSEWVNSNILTLTATTSSTTGVVFKGTTRFIHDFKHPTGSTAVPTGYNLFIGEDAGNFTMGSTATQAYHGSYNTFIGRRSGYSNTIGYQNTFIGVDTGYSNTTGYSNSFIGHQAGYSNTTGYQNAFISINAGYSNTTGYRNTFIGQRAGHSNTTGYQNVYIGRNAGVYIANGSDPNQTTNTSVYIGNSTKASADGVSNEIVIGYDGIGNGTNTITFGDSNISNTIITAGKLTVTAGGAVIGGDPGSGVDGALTLTNATAAPDSTTATLANVPNGMAAAQSTWIKFIHSDTITYIPGWQTTL